MTTHAIEEKQRLKSLFDATEDCNTNELITEFRNHLRSSLPEEIKSLDPLKEIPVNDYPPGVYFLTKDYKITYIGRSVNPMSRILTHRLTKDHRGKVKDFDKAYLLPVSDLNHLDGLEGALIRLFNPYLNGRENGNEFEDHKYLSLYAPQLLTLYMSKDDESQH
jgi:hypothetical protein